jgi:ABC-type nitrate/sulfonate/bicarbonate transport system substrate-binding protein/LysM repeat protein
MGKKFVVSSLVFCLLGFLLLLSPVALNAADRPLEKIRIAYSAISGSQLPTWIAYEQGFFRKYGLDVQLIFVEGGSLAVQTLVSGDVTAAAVAGASVVQSNLQNSGLVMIAGFQNTMDYQLIVSKEITRPDQLKGKTLAVSRFGSSSDFATRYAIDRYGLSPEKDVTIVQIGTQPARFAALETGKIHGAMVSIPLTAKARKMGLNALADLQMLGLEYQHTGLAVSQSLIRSKPELVRNITKSFVDAIYYLKTHRKESLAVLQKYLKTDDIEALEETYEAIGMTLIPERPYPTLKGIQVILREMGAKDPKAAASKPEQFVDLTFVGELDKSGFVDRLYKSTPVLASREERPVVKPTGEEKIRLVSKPTPAALAKPTDVSVNPAPAQLSSPTPVKRPMGEEYTIKSGDSLTKLAERYYGSVGKWEKIYEANRDSIKNPNYIFIGQKIIIPPAAGSGT